MNCIIGDVTLNALRAAQNVIKVYRVRNASNAAHRQHCYRMKFAFEFAMLVVKIAQDGNRMNAQNATQTLNCLQGSVSKFVLNIACRVI